MKASNRAGRNTNAQPAAQQASTSESKGGDIKLALHPEMLQAAKARAKAKGITLDQHVADLMRRDVGEDHSQSSSAPDALAALPLTADERKALAILSEWSGDESQAEYIASAVRLAFTGAGDLLMDEVKSGDERSREAAREFIGTVRPLFQRIAAGNKDFVMPWFEVVDSPSPAPPASALPNSADVTKDAEVKFEDAMCLLLVEGESAVALLVLQAASIAWQTKDSLEFEQYNVPGFVNGCESLSQTLAKDFNRAGVAYHQAGIHVLNKIFERRSLMAHPDFVRLWEGNDGAGLINHGVWCEMDQCATALASCLRRQGELLCNRGDRGAAHLSESAAGRIEAAWNACERGSYPVARAAKALELLATGELKEAA